MNPAGTVALAAGSRAPGRRSEVQSALRVLVASGLLLVVGCTEGQRGTNAARALDSAGVRIMNLPSVSTISTRFALSDQPIYRVGWSEGGHEFEDIVAGSLWPDGRAVVGDAGGSLEIVFLSRSGVVDTVVGGPGQGPSELRSIFGVLALGGDTVAVQDSRNSRVTLFDGTRGAGMIGLTTRGSPRLLGTDSNGDLLMGPPLQYVYPMLDLQRDERWVKAPLVRVRANTGEADTVSWVDWDASFAPDGGDPLMSGGFATVANGRFVFGRGDRPEIRWLDDQGSVVQIARWNDEPPAVTDSMIDAWERASRTVMERYGLPSTDIESRISTMKEAIGEVLPLFGMPAPEPQYGGLIADLRGNVWIAGYVLPHVRSRRPYYVLSPEGEWVALVEVPAGLRVLAIGDGQVLVVERNGFDVQAVALYQLENPTRP